MYMKVWIKKTYFLLGCTIVIKNHGTELRESTSYWDEVNYSQTTCEAACESDSSCFGYSFDSDSGECMKSTETVYTRMRTIVQRVLSIANGAD